MRPAAGLRLFSKCFCLCCSWTFKAKPEPRMPWTDWEWCREPIQWSVTFIDLYRPAVGIATASCLLQHLAGPFYSRERVNPTKQICNITSFHLSAKPQGNRSVSQKSIWQKQWLFPVNWVLIKLLTQSLLQSLTSQLKWQTFNSSQQMH